MLKLGTRHPETEHEHLALQHWHGDGAVLLLRADPRRMAMLLERLSYADLTDVWDVEACEIVAGFYPRLHKPAPPQLMRLSAYVGELPRAARRAAPGRARAASPGRAGGLARPGLRRRPRHGRPADPRRPALRERAGRRARAVAGDRPAAEVGRPALRGGPAALEPVGRARRRRARRRHGGASTPWSTRRGWTRTGPGTGSSSGCSSTCSGSSRRRSRTGTGSRSTSPPRRRSRTKGFAGRRPVTDRLRS